MSVELRWLERRLHDNTVFAKVYRVLQYREPYSVVSGIDHKTVDGWSDWQDVPVVSGPTND